MLLTLLILAVLEVSLSFDNAVVNAKVLRRQSKFMQTMFLTIGWLVAVVAVRWKLPILIVALTSGLTTHQVADMAIHDPNQYAGYLISAHPYIAAFGGTFLTLVFWSFLLEDGKDRHWAWPEQQLNRLTDLYGEIPMIICAILLTIAFLGLSGLPLGAGFVGIGVFFIIRLLGECVAANSNRIHAGIAAFLYLEILDASFSMDGVVAAFSVTSNIYYIALGLGIGAWAIRVITVNLVRRNTLQDLPYLEHGAHWGIGILGLLMLVSNFITIPGIATGIIAVGAIVMSTVSSLIERQRI